MKLYRVARWDQFETSETQKLKHLKWVPVPNKHDGLGFKRVATQKNACELFAAWNLILQVASKGRKDEERGDLIRNGIPLTADDLALMTCFPAKIFETAFAFFTSSQMGWLIVEDYKVANTPGESPAITAEAAEKAGASPAEGRKEGIEKKEGMNGNSGGEIQTLVSVPSSKELAEEIYELYPRKAARADGLRAIIKALTKTTSDNLREKTLAYAIAVTGGDPQYIPHPATWYNGERYNDDPASWRISNSKGTPPANPRNAPFDQDRLAAKTARVAAAQARIDAKAHESTEK